MKRAEGDQLDLFGNLRMVDGSSTMGGKKRISAPKSARRSTSAKGGKPPRPPTSGTGGNGSGGDGELDASLQEETRRRYLNYAMSVITARALPDVRDGLKPVQRRILYAMHHDEHLHPDSKYRKSAKVVGTVIGRYHPHGDTAVYDTMVRMAQDFSMRVPLVDGQGNFGSLDGDGAAAYRYTECRLAPPAVELLRELKQDTVAFRDNYDGTTTEPVVMPARYPNLLCNGSTGIAVGMATNIPPHNLREVTKALIALADDRELTTTNLLKYLLGPDFPTGGQMLNSKVELRQIYEEGSGAIRTRGEYKLEKRGRNVDIIIKSIPYALSKATVVEKIADVIIARKLPQLIDVRDESTTDVRIVLETKANVDPEMVMAYLFKHTPLQQNFNVNMTCLVPTGGDVGQPQRVGIKELLEHFLDFRFDVTRRRFEFELAALKKRIHILEGFVRVFNALDETIKIIRKSDGKKDAAQKLMKRFKLDEVQVEAILELKLYKLARLEINLIRAELKEKRTEAERIERILASNKRLWGVVKTELAEVADAYGTPRRTKTGGVKEEVEFDADAYIVDEDAHIVVTRDGWIKRQGAIKSVSKLRTREGDKVTAVLPGSTRECVVFFSNYGAAYVVKINDIPATSGYGSPAQKHFKFKDGERIVSSMSLDPRGMPPEHLLAITARGFGQQFSIEPYKEVTTRAGRRFARPPKGDEVVDVVAVRDNDVIVVATRKGHVLVTSEDQINYLENPGKGVTVIKTAADDRVIGFIAGSSPRKDALHVESAKGGRKFSLFADPNKIKARGGKGHQVVKRSTLKLTPQPVMIPVLANADGGEGVH